MRNNQSVDVARLLYPIFSSVICYAAPDIPASLITAQLQDRRKSVDSNTDINYMESYIP